MKFLEIDLLEYMQKLCSEIYKILQKEIKED